MNQVILTGKIAKDIEFKDEKTILTIAVPRNYKNAKGEYESDIIPCILWNGVINKLYDMLHEGDTIGIRGLLQNVDNNIFVIADKITFITEKKEHKQ